MIYYQWIWFCRLFFVSIHIDNPFTIKPCVDLIFKFKKKTRNRMPLCYFSDIYCFELTPIYPSPQRRRSGSWTPARWASWTGLWQRYQCLGWRWTFGLERSFRYRFLHESLEERILYLISCGVDDIPVLLHLLHRLSYTSKKFVTNFFVIRILRISVQPLEDV